MELVSVTLKTGTYILEYLMYSISGIADQMDLQEAGDEICHISCTDIEDQSV